jgi:type II secretory pathway component HofQ
MGVIALSWGAVSISRAQSSVVNQSVSFSDDVDAAIADLDKILAGEAPTQSVEEIPASEGVAEAVSEENADVIVDSAVTNLDRVLIEAEVESPEDVNAEILVVQQVSTVEQVAAMEAVPLLVDEVAEQESVADVQAKIAAELADDFAEEAPVSPSAAKEFSGFEPAVAVAAPTDVVADVNKADTLVLGTRAPAVFSDRVTVQLDNAGLEETINLFSQLSGVNIIIPQLEQRDSTVTVNLNDVEWKPALQSVLESYDLELYQKVPSVAIYTIRAKSMDAPEPQELKTFRLSYATVDEVEELVTSVLSEGSRVSKFPSRNMITVRSTAGALEELDRLIKLIDIPREQVFIEAKFMELSDSASEAIGLDWSMLSGFSTSSDTLSFSYSATNKMSVSKVTTAVLSSDDFSMTLAALKELDGTRIVSNPKIIVANEETASIEIGTKTPNIKGTTTTSGDDTTITTYELDDTEPYFTDGIKVSVTPTVNTQDHISVKIEPTLDRLDSSPTTAADGTEFWGKTTKTISTVFSLQSGQTAAIGGLTEVTTADVESKVPVLGSIPLLGRLFSYSKNSKDQVETIIFVTVGLANPRDLDFETGLPEDSSLARRYRVKNATDRAVLREELRLLEAHEAERGELKVRNLKEAERKRVSELPEIEEFSVDSVQ